MDTKPESETSNLLDAAKRVSFNPELNLSTLLEVLVLVVTIVGSYFGLVSNLERANERMENQIQQMSATVSKLDTNVQALSDRMAATGSRVSTLEGFVRAKFNQDEGAQR